MAVSLTQAIAKHKNQPHPNDWNNINYPIVGLSIYGILMMLISVVLIGRSITTHEPAHLDTFKYYN